MMKKLICMLTVIAMLLCCGACKSSKETDSSDSVVTSEDIGSVESTDGNDSQAESTESSSGVSSVTGSASAGSSTKPHASTAGTEKLSSVPKSLRGTTIKVYSWNAAKDVPGATTVMSKFQKETGIKIKWDIGSYDNYKSEIAAMVAAKNSPDIIRLRGVEPGILSLMDPITVSGYNFTEAQWDSFVSKTYTVKNKIYGVNRKNTLLQQPLVMFYNKELITKYDLDDPYAVWKKNKSNWNWDKFFELCNSYKKAAGADSTPWMLNTFKDYAMTFNANHVTRNGDKFVSTMGDKNLLTGYQKVAELRMNKIAFFGWDMNGFNSGKYLFFGPAIISARRTHFDLTDLKTKGSLGVAPYPCVKGQSTYYQNVFEVEAYGIPKGAKNAVAVPYFLNYYLDGDKYDKSTFFNDKRILDVYNYCMNETTLVPEYDRWVLHLDFGGDKYQEFLGKLQTATKDQIPQIISTYTPIVENAVKEANKMLAEDIG